MESINKPDDWQQDLQELLQFQHEPRLIQTVAASRDNPAEYEFSQTFEAWLGEAISGLEKLGKAGADMLAECALLGDWEPDGDFAEFFARAVAEEIRRRAQAKMLADERQAAAGAPAGLLEAQLADNARPVQRLAEGSL